jgi:hypothetical protein
VYCGWLCFELVFIIIFIVETRGRTLEETAALFDGEERPEDLVQVGGDVIVIRDSTLGGERGEDDLYPKKPQGIESYQLQRPHIALTKDDVVGYKKTKYMSWSP